MTGVTSCYLLTGSGHKPAPIIIETPTPVVESKENKKKPRQRTNPQQVKITVFV